MDKDIIEAAKGWSTTAITLRNLANYLEANGCIDSFQKTIANLADKAERYEQEMADEMAKLRH